MLNHSDGDNRSNHSDNIINDEDLDGDLVNSLMKLKISSLSNENSSLNQLRKQSSEMQCLFV
ncbi:hypothetical protein QR98_0014940 [Sarcoptes scabiei]|uniref:Uncharacterized protein n=1 Tax=Sarcoptes scabiei TaxID=52283 RepID=A0A131ZWH8_SARSC|nr:hypothetical protein QR98_0014940 [Sarcoptes scabiei]